MRVSLPSAAVEVVDENAGYEPPASQVSKAAELEQHIEESLSLKIHHDEDQPAVDPTIAERIRIPFGREDLFAELYIRECDGTACVIYGGEVVVLIEDHLSRHGAISEAAHAFYGYLASATFVGARLLASELNAYIAKTIDDPTKIVPAGEVCEWPLSIDIADEPPTDDTTDDSDINPDGDVQCDGDIDDGSAVNSEIAGEDLLGEAPAGDAAVEIVALCDKQAGFTPADESTVNQFEVNVLEPAVPAAACGERGVVGAPPCIDMGEVVDAYEAAVARSCAESLYEQSLNTAKDWYVKASQHRARLQLAVKAAKEEEAERLEVVDNIEARGWQYFLPSKKPAAAPVSASSTDGPQIPSHESTLPPPELPPSPQAGVSGANDSGLAAGPFRPDWQSASIDELKLKKSLTTRLKEAGYETIGKLEAVRAKFEGLLSIDGVGRAKADEIEESLLGWLTKNRDSSAINEVREKNRAASVAQENVSLEQAAQSQ